MKKLMILAIAFLTLNTMAQDKIERKEFVKDLTAEELAILKTKKMTLHLDLTDTQQRQVNQILLEDARHKEKMRSKREKNSSIDKKSTHQDRLKRMNEKLDRQIAIKQKMKSILTSEQYKKWEISFNKANKKRHKKSHKNKSVKRQ